MEVLRRLFRIPSATGHLESPSAEPLDSILVSFDLETTGWVNNRRGPIREAGFAVLDTRHLFPMSSSLSQQQQDTLHGAISKNGGKDEHGLTSKPPVPLVYTKQFSVLRDSESYRDSDITDFREGGSTGEDAGEWFGLVDFWTEAWVFYYPSRIIFLLTPETSLSYHCDAASKSDSDKQV